MPSRPSSSLAPITPLPPTLSLRRLCLHCLAIAVRHSFSSNGSNQVTKVIGDPTSHGAQFLLPSSASVRSAAVVSFAPLSPLPQPSIVPLHPNFDSEAANRIKPLSCGLYPLACPCPRCLSLSIPYKPLEQILIILQCVPKFQ